MDRLKKSRAPVRSSFTRVYNQLIAQLKEEAPSKSELEKSLGKLERGGQDLKRIDEQVLGCLLDNDCTDDVYAEEHKGNEEYQDKVAIVRYDVEQFILGLQRTTATQREDTSEGSATANRKKFKLPKLELIKFGGEIKDWLVFWSQFRKIHEDEEIEPEDKFQYLIQATIKGSRARDLVESFPATSDNYPKVIERLKGRFGKDDLIVEVYVRELLGLVLQNANSTRERVPLAKLYDRLETHLRALESLGVTSDKYAAMLFPLVESCLPDETLRAWQRSVGYASAGDEDRVAGDSPKSRLEVLMSFIRCEVEGEERINLARIGFCTVSKTPPSRNKPERKPEGQEQFFTAAGLLTTDKSVGKKREGCVFCEKSHLGQDCFNAQKMNFKRKQECLSKRRCCYICFKEGHIARTCRATIRCPLCGKKHFAIMCPGLPNGQEMTSRSISTVTKPEVTEVALANCTGSQEVILQTLIVNLKGTNQQRAVRALIDTGSQRSYIVRKSAEEMGYESISEENIIQSLFGGIQSAPSKRKGYRIHLSNLSGDYACNFLVLEQEKICEHIPRLEDKDLIMELEEKGICLSDHGGGNCPPIELLIGADVAGKLLGRQVKELVSGLVAVETRLGWTVMGRVAARNGECGVAMMVTSMFVKETSLQDLWNLDSIGIRDCADNKTKDELEKAATAHFQATLRYNEDKRYEVHLPWIEGHPTLPSNRIQAERRLVNMTKSLVASGHLQRYEAVFRDWKTQGIIEEVPREELAIPGHYMPHRAVFNEKSMTTPVRPVFDASAREKRCPSLNDCLEKGPNLIELIPSVMMKFREKRLGVVADIRQAFLQISVTPRDRNFLRFLWWENVQQETMTVFRHNRVVFGVNCSPFLLAAVIRHHLAQAPGELKATATILSKSLYVDNCLASVDTVDDLERFTQEAKLLMSSAHFELSGWENTVLKASDQEKIISVLGMSWNNHQDTLQCTFGWNENSRGGPVTKREILAVAHSVFDPIGFVCPATLIPKKILQESWMLKVGWDASLPTELENQFLKWKKELPLLADIQIPRSISGLQPTREGWSIHTFCDASQAAYAAVVFLRVETMQGVQVSLLQAKTRVAPIKKVTIPRLELLACCIGARLTASVKNMLELDTTPIYYWSDSSTALCWIKKAEQWGVFVHNRVSEINQLTHLSEWRHVPGEINPADLPSRGCSPRQLKESRWWEGPTWLQLPKKEWPAEEDYCDEEKVNQERRKTVVSNLVTTDEPRWYMQYFSSYVRIVRMVAWMMRFMENSREKGLKKRGALTVQEIEEAEKRLLKIVQRESFGNDLEKRIRPLSAFKDVDGLIRLKTKIILRKDYHDFRSPVILSARHPLVEKIIHGVHLENSHAGIQVVLSILRERWWVLRGRKAVREVIRKCVPCKRHTGKALETPTVTLPEDRVKEAAVFEIVGVDLAGPLFLKNGDKAWIVLYTCAIYRAVHLELVTSLSTVEFLQSFRRFIARRGRPTVVYSDNGTNFVGADNALKTLDWDTVENSSSLQRIQWKFNPPTAAWWGGWWERIVRMIKQLLRRVLGRAVLNYEELSTILCDCESVINSRPLTYLSEDTEDLTALTPAMFLHEIQGSQTQDLDRVIDARCYRRRLCYQRKIRDDLKQRFRKEYLGQLVQGVSGKAPSRGVKLGEIVLVQSDNLKRLNWPLARVLELFPGKDGNVRVVRLKTAGGELTRPIQRLYPLEMAQSNEVESQYQKVVRSRKTTTSPDKSKKTQTSPDKSRKPSRAEPSYTRSGREVKCPKRLLD